MQPDAPEAREGMRSSADNSSGWGETSSRTFFLRWMDHLLLALPFVPTVPPVVAPFGDQSRMSPFLD